MEMLDEYLNQLEKITEDEVAALSLLQFSDEQDSFGTLIEVQLEGLCSVHRCFVQVIKSRKTFIYTKNSMD